MIKITALREYMILAGLAKIENNFNHMYLKMTSYDFVGCRRSKSCFVPPVKKLR